MPDPLATGSVLYCPYIHVRSLDHVKAALIYWDRVRRIVPDMMRGGQDRKYAVDDSYDAQLLADRGLLVCTDPVPYEKQAADKFFEHIAPQAANFRIDLDTGRELARNKRGIHIEKIGMEFLWRLQQLELAHKFGDRVSMHDEVGAFYIFGLALRPRWARKLTLLFSAIPAKTPCSASLCCSNPPRLRKYPNTC